MYFDKNFRKLKIVGKTTDGKLVVSGIFPVVNSEGLSLDLVIEMCKDKNYIIDWLDFILVSIQTGWKLQSTIAKIYSALQLIYGEDHANEWIKGINEIWKV